MTPVERWCRVTIRDRDGAAVAGFDLSGDGQPDLGTVDALARLALLAKRIERRVTVAEMTGPLRELLDLVGLRLEMEGEPEAGEEALRVQEVEEEVHPRDAPS